MDGHVQHDGFGRDINYLRIAVTDKCNFRCIYCMPADGVAPRAHDELLSAEEIAAIYKDRWQIELFFKKLKQNLKIKTFVGTTLNAVMVQIWTALVVTLLLEVLKRRSKYPWSFSRLRNYIRLNLMTYKDLNDWLNEPDIVPIKTRESPPQGCLF